MGYEMDFQPKHKEDVKIKIIVSEFLKSQVKNALGKGKK